MLRPRGQRVEHVEEHERREGHRVLTSIQLLSFINDELNSNVHFIKLCQGVTLSHHAILERHEEDEHGARNDDGRREEHVYNQLL